MHVRPGMGRLIHGEIRLVQIRPPSSARPAHTPVDTKLVRPPVRASPVRRGLGTGGRAGCRCSCEGSGRTRPRPTTVADCGGRAAADTWPRQIRIDACPEQGAPGDPDMPGPTTSSGSGKLPSSLYGKRLECAVLDELLEQVRRGRSTVLVMRDEAGVGKTALLEYMAARARGCRLARVTGVPSGMELAF